MTAPPRPGAARIPWYIWLAALAVTSAIIGIQWDISWHRSIGRDEFLTPAHLAIYLCGILAGLFCGYLVFAATFGHSALRAASVKVWGLHGPLGAFVAAWGGFAMLTSAPFDDWWHGAYGLDVKILSPPHVVLALGIFAIQAGVVLLVAAQRNRAVDAASKEKYDRLFLYVGGTSLVLLMTVTLEYTGVVVQHHTMFYQAMCMTVPATLALIARASGRRFAATTVAAFYMLFMLGMLWILPLFPAQPKLGPVYHEVTHFVPAGFPVLLIFPALALDLFWGRFPTMNAWLKSLISGPLYLAVLMAVQWQFASLLFSPAAMNAFFGGIYVDYLTRPNSLIAKHLFFTNGSAGEWWTGVGLAALFSVLAVRLGLARGDALGKVQR
jgi:hypothetical protein